MKKEATKKNKLWLWLVIGVAVLAVVAAGVLALVLGGGQEKDPGGRAELYWNLDRTYYTENSETGMSTREPGEDGLYHIRFAYEGEVKEYTVADKRLVNFIDNFSCLSLTLNDQGEVVDAVEARDAATEVAKEVYVRYFRNDTLYVNTSIAMNGMTLMLDVTDVTRIYNVSPDADPMGGVITADRLQPMDCVTIYGNDLEQNTHIYLQSKPEKSPVYWRVEGLYDGEAEGTKRVPDESGTYSIDFFCDGELVTLKCRDKKIVDYVDYKSDYKAHFGFVFDEEGYIVKRVESQIGIQARCIGEGYDVTSIDDVEIELTSTIWSNAGDVEGFKLEEDTRIYDVSKAAFSEGRRGKAVDSLQLGDRVVVWKDTENDAVLVYITERLVDSPMYFNVTRKYSTSKKESTRTPNADGWYEVELAVNGEVKTFKTKDKAKIDYLDSFSPRGLGLKVVNGNEIEYVYHANCIYGYKYFCDGRYVTSVNSGLLQLWSRPQDKTYNCVLDPELKVYDMSGVTPLGSETTLQQGDNVLAYQKPTGEIVCAYVMRRACEDADLYWNLSRKYDATTKQTTRVPDENGWYVFSMAMGGKTVTVKTKSREMATKIDAFSPAAIGMIVEGGIVQAVFDPQNVAGGNRLTSGTYVSAMGDGTIQTYSYKTGKYLDMTLAPDCKIYNVSAAYIKEKGEITKLQMGDMINVYANIKNEAAIIVIRTRDVEGMYWKQDRFYDSTNEVTTRVPDAEGWYIYNLAINGELKTFKTKDPEVANKMDKSESGFGVLKNGDEIIRYLSASNVKDVSADGVINWDVVAVDGRKVTVKYNRTGSTDTGKTKTITLAANAKIMDVSPTAEAFGAYTQLQPGDRIRSYVNLEEQHLYVWIKFRANREKGVESYCEHCGETVFWNPYLGGSVPKGNAHYYLVEDTVTTSQTTIGSDEIDYEVVIDLNGKTLTKEKGRAMLVYKGDKLTVMDSVGGGEVRAAGSSAGYGAVLLVNGDAEFTLMGGTLRYIPGETVPCYGGVVSVTGKNTVFNMTGGKLTDGRLALKEGVSRTIGGNLYCYQATVNISGGIVENGEAMRGGNLYFASDSVFNMTGGEIKGGVTEQDGGNVFVSTRAKATVTGGVISGGEAAGYGGNLYVVEGAATLGGAVTGGKAKYGGNVAVSAGELNITGGSLENGAARFYGGNIYARGNVLNITGGKISGGNAGDYAGNIYFPTSSTCEMNISGGEIVGDVRLNGAGKVTVSGAPKIGIGTEGGLDMRNGVALTLGKLTAGADIAISRTGAFTQYTEKAKDYVNYFRTAKEGGAIYEQDGILYASAGAIRYAHCDHCGETALWTAWENTATPASGHYYLTGPVDMGRTRVNIGTSDNREADIVLDLNGNSWTTGNNRAFWVYGDMAIMDTVGGGEILASGSNMGSGGVIRVDGSLTLYSGTIRRVPSDSLVGKGGVLQLTSGSEFIMKDGKLTGGVCVAYTDGDGDAVDSQGGSIYAEKATIRMEGGVIEGGSAVTGGNLYLKSSTFQMTGGNIVGGEVASYGGNIYAVEGAMTLAGAISGGKAKYGGNVAIYNGTLAVTGGSLTDGAASLYGGNAYVRGESVFDITGGKISGGSAGDYAGNIYLPTSSTCALNISGGEIVGDIRLNGAGKVTVSGAPKIGVGTEGGLDMRNGVALTLGDLSADADIAISGTGAFTINHENAEQYTGCFRTAKEGGVIYAQYDILYASAGAVRFAHCDHCAETVLWKAWENTANPASDHYYLAGPVDMGRTRVNVGTSDSREVQIVLDLNGNTWTTGNNRAFWVYGDMVILDTVGGGEITASGSNMGSGGVIRVDGSLTLYSGTIRRVPSDSLVGKGGVLQLTSGSEFIMKDGKLTGGTCVAYTDGNGNAVDSQGGSIYAENASITMEGGVIEGGSAVVGGNLYLKDSTFEMTGGEIIGGAAEGNGGNIFSSGATTTVIDGGVITGGTAGDSGADYYVYNKQGKLTVRNAQVGDIRIRSVGTATLDGKVLIDSMKLSEGVKLTLDDLSTESVIGITATGAFTEPSENAQSLMDANCFVSIPAGQVISVVENVFVSEIIPEGAFKAVCQHCSQEVLWQVWENVATPASGHYYLAGPVDMGRTRVNIGTSDNREADIVLDLNGNTWTTGNNRAFWIYGDMAIMDTVGGGEILASGSNMGSGGVIRVDGSLTLYSGTIRRVPSDSLVGKGGVLQLTSGSEFIMKDGKLTGGTCVAYTDGAGNAVDSQGGSIYAEKATIRMEGGVIEGGSAVTGGNLYLKDSTFQMTGGTVIGGTTTGSGGNIFLTGSVMEMTGGIVTGGTATGNGGNFFMEKSQLTVTDGSIEDGLAGNRGGNILIDLECSFAMSGGMVRGGQAAKQGGNIRLNYGSSEIWISGGTIMGDMTVYSAKSVTLSGSPKILMGNSAGLILGDGVDPSAGNAKLKLTLSELQPDAQIYISAVGEITDGPAAQYLDCFKGALRTAVTANGDGILEATQGNTGFCPHCWQTGVPATWTDAAQIPVASSGSYTRLSENAHYYLTGDITRSGSTSRLNIGGTSNTGVDVVIDLSGYNWKVTNNRVAQIFAQLTVMDSLCKGTMQGGNAGTAEPYSSVFTINHNNASLTLYSGTLKAAAMDECAINCNKGVFHMYGGYVIGAEEATKETVILGAAGQLDRTAGIVDGKRKEESTD